jgi:predicted NAD-dependent protein-ADP-ribosyltransferase YbiA (DUF1768 family)
MAATTDPKTHKALGRKVKGFDGKVWDQNKLGIVEEGNYWKFSKSEDAENLKLLLLSTGEREIVEVSLIFVLYLVADSVQASPLDRIWGIGFGKENAEKNRHKWGQNLLGIALMNVRRRLREESK